MPTIQYVKHTKNKISRLAYFNILSIVESRDALHKVRCRMISKIRTNISYTQPSIQSFLVLIWALVQYVNLQQNKLFLTICKAIQRKHPWNRNQATALVVISENQATVLSENLLAPFTNVQTTCSILITGSDCQCTNKASK